MQRGLFLVLAALALLLGWLTPGIVIASPATTPRSSVRLAPKPSSFETYQDLIQKARNLTLQNDRLQASQVLIRGLQRETSGSAAYKELVKTLDELSAVFYTEKAQALFANGETLTETKPKEAIEQFQEALRVEDGNVAILKALAREHLVLRDCDKAETSVKGAEAIDPYSDEVRLLSLQLLACQKKYDALLDALEEDFSDEKSKKRVDKKGDDRSTIAHELYFGIKSELEVQAIASTATPKGDLKKARTVLQAWEAQATDKPELLYWKFELSKIAGSPDRTLALKYSQACQNLTPRKRKNYSLDVNLCKGKEAVDAYLKESGATSK